MSLQELGEFGLIQRIAVLFKQPLPPGVEGIGNDCAVLPFCGSRSLLATTDLLIEYSHFLTDKISPQDLGYKAFAVNLSDIAAMGGIPHYAFLSLGLPAHTSTDWIDHLLEGMKQLATAKHVLLLGGDTTEAPQVILNIVIIGSIETAQIKRRSQAQPGDIICCTGYLGESRAGLKILVENYPLNEDAEAMVQAHVRPRPHLEEGAWLSAHTDVHAMMDVSDGLSSDIQRIMEESHCGAHLEMDRLPISPSLQRLCKTYGWSARELALSGGEEYCLLVTVQPDKYSALQQAYEKYFQRPLFRIGTILDSSFLLTDQQSPVELTTAGFDHFKKR